MSDTVDNHTAVTSTATDVPLADSASSIVEGTGLTWKQLEVLQSDKSISQDISDNFVAGLNGERDYDGSLDFDSMNVERDYYGRLDFDSIKKGLSNPDVQISNAGLNASFTAPTLTRHDNIAGPYARDYSRGANRWDTFSADRKKTRTVQYRLADGSEEAALEDLKSRIDVKGKKPVLTTKGSDMSICHNMGRAIRLLPREQVSRIKTVPGEIEGRLSSNALPVADELLQRYKTDHAKGTSERYPHHDIYRDWDKKVGMSTAATETH